jgi:hypothetical protein
MLDHDLARIAMGQGIQASEERDPAIHHDDLLMHIGVGHHARNDLAKLSEPIPPGLAWLRPLRTREDVYLYSLDSSPE